MLRGAGTAEPRSSYGAVGRSIDSGVPFPKAGVFRIGGGPFVIKPRTEVSRTHLALTEETPRGPEISRDMSRFSGRRFRTERETDSNDTESAEAVSCPLRPILQVRQSEARLLAVLSAP